MAEILLRSADPKIIEAAVGRMKGILEDIGDLVGQLQASIDASKRIGEVVPPVSIFLGSQVAGKSMLNKFQDALDSLTITVRDSGSVAPVLDSGDQAKIVGRGHA